MNLQFLVDTYGYLAVLVGTFFEGETVLVLGGFAAHRGYLHLPWVIVAAFVGTLCGDQLFFLLGRRHSRAILTRRPSWRRRIDKVDQYLQRFGTPLILAFRFLYGLRSVTPFVIGMSEVPAAKFISLNALGALVWAIAVGAAGYLFGNALEIILGNVKRFELQVFIAIAIVGSLLWIFHFVHRRRRNRFSKQSGRAPYTPL